MTIHQATGVESIKARIKATWTAGDYGRVAQFTEGMAREFIDRCQISPQRQVLDVACGTGNLCIPAGKAGAVVTGIDIAPNLLEEARSRSVREGLKINFDEGDAENLPYEADTFDLVVSMFGVMFAPQPDIVAREICRVCRPGGRIAIASWTPTGFIGELFKVTGKHVTPPTGVPSPLLWGDENAIRARLGDQTSDLQTTRILAAIALPFSIAETVEFYRLNYGPTLKAFASLSEVAQAALRSDLEDLYARHNQATDGTVRIAAEFLEVVATKL
jgi:2-polyprenyl-3-methyl-5-hydroxy-6-metoxy-1,4-benzoquinol methylase